MDRAEAVRQRLTHAFDLPEDVLLDVPRVVMAGSLHVTIENHRGLVEYNQERVTLAFSGGQMVIEGSGLDIGVITADVIVIRGRIGGLRFGPG